MITVPEHIGALSESAGDATVRLGEVTYSATTEFTAESYTLHQAPPFGSLLHASEGDVVIYGVTASVTTGSVDQGRRPLARGHDESTEDDLYHNNPELKQLLRTEFTAVVVGFRDIEVIRQFLPPRPPHVHSFVYQCSGAEVREFGSQLGFLATLLAVAQRGATDELVAACLRQISCAYGAGSPDRTYLVRAGKELAGLLSGDVSRLNSLLRRIRA